MDIGGNTHTDALGSAANLAILDGAAGEENAVVPHDVDASSKQLLLALQKEPWNTQVQQARDLRTMDLKQKRIMEGVRNRQLATWSNSTLANALDGFALDSRTAPDYCLIPVASGDPSKAVRRLAHPHICLRTWIRMARQMWQSLSLGSTAMY